MEPTPPTKHKDFWPIFGLLGVTAVLFWPATRWVAEQTLAHEQLRQSFYLLLFAAAVLWIDNRPALRPVMAISPRGLQLLGVSFALMLAAVFIWQTALLPLAAFAFALAGFVHIIFGDSGFKVSLPWVAAFAAFLVFILFFHVVDWPLRRLAGVQAAQLLAMMGYEVELAAVMADGAKLLLAVGDQLFEVAGECNGFGLMSSSAVLALLLVFGRDLPLYWKGFAVLLAFIVGFLFNTLRILGIVLLAPRFPNHYDAMHETIGLIALFAGLGFLWWLLGGIGPSPAKPKSGGDSPAASAAG